jgi:hypothetical protein
MRMAARLWRQGVEASRKIPAQVTVFTGAFEPLPAGDRPMKKRRARAHNPLQRVSVEVSLS